MQSSRQVPGTENTREEGIFFFSAKRVALAAKLVGICVAVTVLMIPIFLLFLTEMSSEVKSVMVLIFVLAFATAISLVTDAKMETVFLGTCA